MSALEELLGFLSSLPAFSSLSREVLTSLAVFIKPVATQAGQVLAVAGQPADSLVIIQVCGGSQCALTANTSNIGCSPEVAAQPERFNWPQHHTSSVLKQPSLCVPGVHCFVRVCEHRQGRSS